MPTRHVRKGYRICMLEILPTLPNLKRCVYGGAFHLLYAALLWHYYATVLKRAGHSSDTPTPTCAVYNSRYTPCLADGQARRCHRDACGGRVKAPRTRHCSVCRRDRAQFDHHCVWFDACIARDTLPSFLITCALMPVVSVVGAAPILPSLLTNFRQVRELSRHDAWVRSVFWDTPAAYFPGPVGARAIRYALGYWRFSTAAHTAHTVRDIRLDVALTALAATVVSGVAAALFCTVMRGVLVSHSSVDIERRRSFERLTQQAHKNPSDPHLQNTLKYLEPVEYLRVGQQVLKVDDRIWHLGWYRNLERLFFIRQLASIKTRSTNKCYWNKSGRKKNDKSPASTVAGIVDSEDGGREIPIKIRPGFRPVEDVERYRPPQSRLRAASGSATPTPKKNSSDSGDGDKSLSAGDETERRSHAAQKSPTTTHSDDDELTSKLSSLRIGSKTSKYASAEPIQTQESSGRGRGRGRARGRSKGNGGNLKRTDNT
ncbi:hypothetical protein E3P96_00564 [Wallemia ichthyophaga]|nr:hypothetical protein E3P96_00564 [Wallemia ichthyophaga]